jgi:hypothetical protein
MSVVSSVVVQYNEEIRDQNLKKLHKQDWRSRWGYITADVFELYKKLRRGELSEKAAEERYLVFLPDGTLGTVALCHMNIVDPFAMVEMVRRPAAEAMPVEMPGAPEPRGGLRLVDATPVEEPHEAEPEETTPE